MINICLGCEKRSKKCTGSTCPCPVDGVDIRIHAEKADCPIGLHDPNAPLCKLCGSKSHDAEHCIKKTAAAFAPGNVVASILQSIGYHKNEGCGCRAFATKMNAWGWRGCIRHRTEILAWFIAKAKEQSIEVDGDKLRHLIRAGLADQWRRWRTQRSA